MKILTAKVSGNGFDINKRLQDSMWVPNDKNNPYFKLLTEWQANGGIVEPEFTDAELMAKTLENYKSIYNGIVNSKLKELDYDSLERVNLWKDDPIYGVEATRILDWYKAIIKRNYELLNAGVLLTDAEYLAEINAVLF